MKSPGKEENVCNSDVPAYEQKSKGPVKSKDLTEENQIYSNECDKRSLEESAISQDSTSLKDCDDIINDEEVHSSESINLEMANESIDDHFDVSAIVQENIPSSGNTDGSSALVFDNETNMSDCKNILTEIVLKVSEENEIKSEDSITKPSESVASMKKSVAVNHLKRRTGKSRGSCPKIKISASKNLDNSDSNSTMKNWYISERKDSTESTQSEENITFDSEHNNLKGIKSSNEISDVSSTILESVQCNENDSNVNVIDSSSVDNSNISDQNVHDRTDKIDAVPINEPSTDTRIVTKTDTDAFVKDKTQSNTIASDVTPEDEITQHTTAIENVSLSTSISDSSVSNAEADNSSFGMDCNADSAEETSAGNEKLPSKDSVSEPSEIEDTQLTEPHLKVKEEPMDIDDYPPIECSDLTAVNIKIEDEEATQEKEVSDPITKPTVTRKARRSATKDLIKTEESILENAGIPQQGTSVKASKSKAMKKGSNSEVPSSQPPSQSSPLTKAAKVSPFPRNRKKTYSLEAVTVPFSMGWMRELVHRSTEGKSGQKQSDIYYFAPEGAKLRSMPEIATYLSRHGECKLKLENFTFAKELIYREPFEIERSAKQKSIITTPSSSSKKETPTQTAKKKSAPTSAPVKKSTSSIKSTDKKLSLSPKSSTLKLKIIKNVTVDKVQKKLTSAFDEESQNDNKKSCDSTNFRSSRRTSNKVSLDHSNKEKCVSKKARLSRELSLSINEDLKAIEMSTSHSPLVQPNKNEAISKANVTQNKNVKKLPTTQNRAKLKIASPKSVESVLLKPCTERCTVADFQMPTVQCAMCLCLFHQNCVPLLAKGLKYACKPCTVRRLEFYESQKQSSSKSESVSEITYPDLPDDLDISFLCPQVILMIPRETTSSNIPQAESGSSSESTAFSGSPSAITNTAFPNRSVPLHTDASSYSPQLLSYLLKPTNASTSRIVRVHQISPNMTNARPQLLMQSIYPNSSQSNFVHLGVRLPMRDLSTALPNSVILRRLPPGKVILRTVSNSASESSGATQQNNDPINALKNLSQDICTSHLNKSYFSCQVPNRPTAPEKGNLISFVQKNNSTCIDTNTIKMGTKNYTRKLVEAGESNSTFCENKTGNSPKRLKLSAPFIEVDKSELVNGLDCSQSSWDMNKLRISYECLSLVFNKLNACDLLSVMQVCKSWRHLASKNTLWQKVSFFGLTVTSWKKCCLFLHKHGTKFMDFTGIVHQDTDMPFKELLNYVALLSGVEELVFDQIQPSVLRSIICSMPQLRRLECYFVTNEYTEPDIWMKFCTMELAVLRCLGRLVKLKIGSGGGIILDRGSEYLMPYLPNLRHVSLTGFKFGSHINLESLSQQKELISLELGDCIGVEPGVYALLGCLTNLKSLRLENGGSMTDNKLSEALTQMKGLEVLELMNFKFPTNLVPVFKILQHLIHLNVWPDNKEEAPLINRNLLQAISDSKDLKYLCWGVIVEGESAPETLPIKSSDDADNDELTFEGLFNKLLGLFPECRVEVKCVPRSSWKEFCSIRN